MKNKLLVTILILITKLSIAQPGITADKIVAIVDNKIILFSDVESQYQQYIQQGAKESDDLRCDLLEQLLTQKLLVAQALLDSVEVSEDEIESELDKRIRYFSNLAGGQDKLEAYYGKSVIAIKEEFRENINQQILAQREQQQIIADIKVTPNDVRDYFNSIPKDSLPYYNATVEVGQIVIRPSVSPEIKLLAKQKLEELRQRILKGEDFSKLAKIYSEDPGSQEAGGELGFTNRGELDPNFEAAAFSLKKPGDMSEVIESAFGYHIIQLIERRGEKVNVRHILVIPKTTSFDITKAKKICDSVYQLLASGKLTFEQAATKFSQDDNTKNNGGTLVNPNSNNSYFDINELGEYDKALAIDIQKMDVNAISTPGLYKTEDGKSEYKILTLKSKTRAHQANLKDDYDKIQSAAEQKKQNEVFNNWLNEKIKKTYIKINSSFINCVNLKKWININE